MVEDELQRLVDSLAETLGRSVAINDPTIHLLCASRHFGDEDDVRVRAVLQRDAGSAVIGHILAQGVTRWTGPGVIPAHADLHMRARLCMPIRWHGTLLGLLIVIDPDGTLGAAQADTVAQSAAAMAAVMYRSFQVDDRERVAREDALRRLTAGSPTTREDGLAALERERWLRDAPYATVSVVEAVADDPGTAAAQVEVALRSALKTVARGHPATVAFAVGERDGLLLQLADRRPTSTEVRAQAVALARQAQDALGVLGRCAVGVGDPADGLADAWRSRAQAETAARAATLLPGTGVEGRVAVWAELGAYATLLQIPSTRLTGALVPEPLRALVEQDPHGRLVETLTAYLDHAGSSPETAAALHIHRTSLYYRLHRIEELTGLDLGNGDHRLTLHLGVRLLALLRPG